MDNDSWLFPAHLPLDDMFDWNGDGKITGFENVLRDAHWINAFETKPEPTTSLPLNFGSSAYYSAQNQNSDAEQGNDVIDDSNMDTYENDAETGSDALDPADYPNKRSYQAAVRLADDLCFNETDEDLCRFILNQADTVTAAKNITQYGKFLFSQAIKDNFDLPCNLPDEDEEPEMTLSDIVNKVSRYDCELAARIWAWCLENIGPY